MIVEFNITREARGARGGGALTRFTFVLSAPSEVA